MAKKKHLNFSGAIFIAILFSLSIGSCKTGQQRITFDIFDNQHRKCVGKIELTGKNGATAYNIKLFGLPPHEQFTIKLYSGDCNHRSASFSLISQITTDDAGNGQRRGTILFRDQENIRLTEIADNEHLITVESDTFGACSTIPKLK